MSARICTDRGIGRHHLPWPVIHLATLLGAGDQDVLRWFTLAVALLLDPAAVLLLLAATRAMKKGAAVPSGAAALFKTA